MSITPWFTPYQAILGLYDVLHSDECNQELYKKNVLVLPSFIIAENGGRDFEAQKVHASIINSTQLDSKAFWRKSMCLSNINIHI